MANKNDQVTSSACDTAYCQSLATGPLDEDDDNDTLPDTWEAQYNFDPLNPSDADDDSDGDGYSNRQEFDGGTDPRDINSFPGDSGPLVLPTDRSLASRVVVSLRLPTSAAAGSTIGWTADGSMPSASSSIYTTPQLFTNDVQIRARIDDNGQLGDVVNANFVIRNEAVPPLPPEITFNRQHTGAVDTATGVSLYLLEQSAYLASDVTALQLAGSEVGCEFSAGIWEAGQPDAASFPAASPGASINGNTDRRWFKLTRPAQLLALLSSRLDTAQAMGCTVVLATGFEGFEPNSGANWQAADVDTIVLGLANAANARGLAFGSAGATARAGNHVQALDFILDEGCLARRDCDSLQVVVDEAKAVLGTESTLAADKFCPAATARAFSWIGKSATMDAPFAACPTGTIACTATAMTLPVNRWQMLSLPCDPPRGHRSWTIWWRYRETSCPCVQHLRTGCPGTAPVSRDALAVAQFGGLFYWALGSSR